MWRKSLSSTSPVKPERASSSRTYEREYSLGTNQLSGRGRTWMWRKHLSFTSPMKPDFHFLPLHTTPNTCHQHIVRLSQNGERLIYVVYYILTAYVCQFQKGKVHFCSSTGVQMSAQNAGSMFGHFWEYGNR